MALTAALITFSTNSNLGEYTMVIISNITIRGVIIPKQELTTLLKLDTMVLKGVNAVITGMISDNSQELPHVVLILPVLIYMLHTIIILTFHTAYKF